MLYDALTVAGLVVLCAIAVQDARTLRVSNVALVVLTGLAIGIVLTRPEPATGLDMATGFGMLGLGVIYWSRGWMGGGDAKLFLPVGLLVGAAGAMVFAIGLVVAGAGMYLLARKDRIAAAQGVPFAVPVFLATLVATVTGLIAR
jgi:prepilin peptidase CpaA